MHEQLHYLASCLKAMKFFYHAAHNLVARVPFFQDHEAFGSFYEEADSDYDDVVERCIGLHGAENFNIKKVIQDACSKFQSLPANEIGENKKFFEIGLSLEKELQLKIQNMCKLPDATEGTKQLIGDIANKSEMRSYKIKQRMK